MTYFILGWAHLSNSKNSTKIASRFKVDCKTRYLRNVLHYYIYKNNVILD